MASYQVQEWLRQGIAAARTGDTKRAYDLLVKVVDVDEYNEQAWMWLSSVVETDADREVCLENVLAINADNKVAKAGLVQLRSKAVQPAPELIEREPPPVRPVAAATGKEIAEPRQTTLEEPAQRPQEAREGVLPSTPASPAPLQQVVADWAKAPATRWRERYDRAALEPLLVPGLFFLGLLAAGLAVALLLGARFLDPARHNYAQAMRPVLEAYETWWDGPQGALVRELDSLCGPGADGWRNRDVLLACSGHPDVACEQLAAHCDADVTEMQEEVAELSQETRATGQALVETLQSITPPASVAAAHGRLVACLQSQLADAARVSRLAQGQPVSTPDRAPVCVMFSTAEEEIRAYVRGS